MPDARTKGSSEPQRTAQPTVICCMRQVQSAKPSSLVFKAQVLKSPLTCLQSPRYGASAAIRRSGSRLCQGGVEIAYLHIEQGAIRCSSAHAGAARRAARR